MKRLIPWILVLTCGLASATNKCSIEMVDALGASPTTVGEMFASLFGTRRTSYVQRFDQNSWHGFGRIAATYFPDRWSSADRIATADMTFVHYHGVGRFTVLEQHEVNAFIEDVEATAKGLVAEFGESFELTIQRLKDAPVTDSEWYRVQYDPSNAAAKTRIVVKGPLDAVRRLVHRIETAYER